MVSRAATFDSGRQQPINLVCLREISAGATYLPIYSRIMTEPSLLRCALLAPMGQELTCRQAKRGSRRGFLNLFDFLWVFDSTFNINRPDLGLGSRCRRLISHGWSRFAPHPHHCLESLCRNCRCALSLVDDTG